MTGLPKLPGFTFSDPTISRFNLSNQFEFINGYKIPKPPETGIGGRELDVNGVAYIQNHDTIRFDPSLTYGRVRGITLPQYIPHFALYDQKCLTFKAFFKQTVVESPDEHYRIRHVNIIYFLENDTMTVMEPRVRNSGIDQGRLVRRSKIPKNEHGEYWSWKDLNIGIDLPINGIVYHTVDCDAFTREFMASQGILLNATEDMPPDPYIQQREMCNAPTMTQTPPADDKLRRFLEYDGKILKFNAAWDNRDSEFGELKEYVILYFLADDTISVKEVHKPNDGCDPCPLLLRKTRLPKNWKDRPVTYPACCLELSEAEVTEYYQPKDLKIGETIFVLGRRFLLYDCDQFTRNYFERVLNIKQGAPIKVFDEEKPYVPRRIPPHEGLALGSLEDSMQNCFQTIPTRPRRDEVRMMLNANKFLRYTMEYDWVHPEDSIRKFVMLYSLAHGTIQIHEPPIRNSGIIGGRFLRESLISKPGSDPQNPIYYTPADFYIGAKIEVNGHRFILTGADLYVYRYMMANPEKFSTEVVDNIRDYMYKQGYLEADIKEKMEENDEIHRKKIINKIGAELIPIKTEREKCLEMYEQQRIEAAKRVEHLRKPQQPLGKDQVEAVIDTQGRPYDHEVVKEVPYGIKPVNKECQYPIFVGDIQSGECKEGQYESGVYTVKYPDTPEETMKKYYDKVLAQHEKACLNAAKYKETHECLPGTQFKETDDPKLSSKILVTEVEKPSPEKFNPCKKQVRFAEPLEKCEQEKEDPCNLNIKKDHCDCTYYDK